jgi:hypothetical protein
MNQSQDPARTLAVRPQQNLNTKKLGFRTASGTEWFEFSPEKMKDYFYELGAIMARRRCLDDISFPSVLEMSSLNIDDLQDSPVFGSGLSTILDCKVKDDTRADMLSRVCGYTLKMPDCELLRYQINELVEADIVAAEVAHNSDDDIYLKVRLDRISLRSKYLSLRKFAIIEHPSLTSSSYSQIT